MRFVILRLLKHNELGMFHSYRRLGKERAKQRAINFDGKVVDRVFPAVADTEKIRLVLRYETDKGVATRDHYINRQEKNWRLEGNCPKDRLYDFVEPGCLFAMVVDSGKRPAVGAWAVYRPDARVTREILMNPESSALTSRSMIALHGIECARTVNLLVGSKKHLFASEVAPMKTDTAKPKQSKKAPTGRTKATKAKGAHLPPNPRRLVAILGSVGHTLPSAVADIVDNAISAQATEIRITFERPDAGHGRWMAVTDNGRGMDPDGLAEAMRIGSDADYDPKDLGKYGYGLKGASWSQTDCFTVVSRMANKTTSSLSWDTAKMDSWERQLGVLEPWMAKAADVGAHGTAVVWNHMRPPQAARIAKMTDSHTAEIMDIERHLGLVFHRFINGHVQGRAPVVIRINDAQLVSANDPVGHPLAVAHAHKIIRLPMDDSEARVGVKVFVLPSIAEVKAMHKGDAEAIRRDQDKLSLYGRANESQGLYLYRNDRLISWGGWHDMWTTSDEKTKLARVTVDFGKELDDRFSVNISKQIVVLPQFVQAELKKLADPARKESKKKYLKDDKPQLRGSPSVSPPPSGKPLPPVSIGGGAASPLQIPVSGRPTAPRIPVRTVKAAPFAWKVSKLISGGRELQVSEKEQILDALALTLTRDPISLSLLVDFLERLDLAEVQKALVGRGD